MNTEFHVLWEDDDLLFCFKPAGVSSEADCGRCMPEIAGKYIASRNGLESPYIGVVHRLDRDTAGVIVFAKTERAAAALSGMFAARETEKEYLAVVCGIPPAEGEMHDLLYHDRVKNKTYVVDRKRRGVKEAGLAYRTLSSVETEDGPRSLVHVRLFTGRTHQIRIQFGSRMYPLAGDARYGGGKGKISLWSCRIAFVHPFSGEKISITSLPAAVDSWALFQADLEADTVFAVIGKEYKGPLDGTLKDGSDRK